MEAKDKTIADVVVNGPVLGNHVLQVTEGAIIMDEVNPTSILEDPIDGSVVGKFLVVCGLLVRFDSCNLL